MAWLLWFGRRTLVAFAFGAVVTSFAVDCPVSTNVCGHENTEWSIGYAYHLTDELGKLPRVLLIGDSICNEYQSGVRAHLEGRMNVSYWVSSHCVTAPVYLKMLAIYLDAAKYDVIHFNNGLHSLQTPVESYAAGIAVALKLIREKQPQARIVWASSTPLADSIRTKKVQELNDAAANVAKSAGCDMDDLFALLDPLDREANWSDAFHHVKTARNLLARQVARCVCRTLVEKIDAAANEH